MALTAKKVYAILKRQISDMEAKLNSPVRYRGTVATADLLPLNPDIGDMYNIESKSVYGEAGMNVAWNGVVWDTMGAPIDMSLYFTKEEAEAVIQRLVTEYFEKNPVKPGATAEQAQQIEQNKTDISSLKTETSSLKEDLSNKITKFYASNQGETHITDSDNGKIQDMMIYGRSSQSTTTGKNLLKYPYIAADDMSQGIIFTDNKDGSISISGTATGVVYYNLYSNIDGKRLTLASGTYKLVVKGRSKCNVIVSNNISTVTNGGTFTITDGHNEIYCYITVQEDLTVDETIYPMIQLASITDESYEPYTGGIPSPSPDYPQEIKSVVNPTVKVTNEDGLKVQSITLNNITLNAIPVSSGGNVTINGQQYVADYVDVERGKLVRMVGTTDQDTFITTKWDTGSIVIYSQLSNVGTEYAIVTISSKYSSDWSAGDEIHHFTQPIGQTLVIVLPKTITTVEQGEEIRAKGFKFYYILVTPIEIDLTEEEITAFKALATYYPVTNISVNSEQLDGYTIFNYPISMANGWNYVKKQLNDNRDYIYDMDLQSAEAYVNSEYAVALTELEV